MADHHNHHHLHRPHRLSLPSRAAFPTPISSTPRHYPPYTPTATPSKTRLPSLSLLNKPSSPKKTSLSFLFLLLFSLRSLYSLLPFLRSSPSFSLFPFSFLVSLLSFLLTLSFSLFTPSSSSSKDPFRQKQQNQPIFSLTLITQSQHKILLSKSLLLAIVFLLRFQALRYCGAAAMILAELSGNVAARFFAEGQNRGPNRIGYSKVRGFFALFIGLFLLSISWDRIECFPLSASNVSKFGFSVLPNSENCLRVWPMLLPFLSGFLGCYERVSMNWGSIRELGRKRVRLISLFFTTVVLFIPAVISVLLFEGNGDSVSIGSLGWPLANTVLFGVLLSENCSDEKLVSSKDLQREYLVTFVCTLLLELFYFPELSLWGLLVCGLLLGIAVRELDPVYSNYIELGLESSESLTTLIMKPVRHILSERKSRKIALFLLINTGYMVVEFAAGFMSNSLGLISDACHMLFDCAALAIGLYASYISRLPANGQFNYGRGRFEVLSGYVNAVFLVLVGALIVVESLERILDPQEISTNSLLTVSIGGLVVNVVGLIFFHEEHHHAHGGSGACSHSSHSHSDSHSHLHSNSHMHDHHHSHDHSGHDHKAHGNHHECIDVSHDCSEKSCSGHDHSHTDTHEHHDSDHHHHHHHHVHHSADNTECHKISSASCLGHDHIHNHDHHHQQHNHHHQQQQHEHFHDHGENQQQQQHEHVHDHGENHDHHHQQHNHNHHQHQQQHEHVHDHGENHHHHFNNHHQQHSDQHLHGSSKVGSSRSFNSHSVKGHSGEDPHVEGKVHSHASSSDLHIPSSSGNCGSQQKGLHSHKEESKRHHHHHIDHNMEGIFLHVLADTMGSVGVVASTLLIKYKGWLVADPACSIFISVLIVSSVIPLLRNSAEILLQRVPRAHEQDLKEALNDIVKIKGVRGIQNWHVWSFTNTEVVGSLHLHVSTEIDKASAKAEVSHILHDAGIKDLTVQVECLKNT